MQIVSQSAALAHSLLPPQRLALPAPRIAGLLSAPKPSAPPADEFHLHDPRLHLLSETEHADLHTAFTTLLTRAVDFMLGESHSLDLRAAADAFQEALSGELPAPHPHATLKSRLDTFWEESEARMAAAEARIKAEVDAMRRQYHVKPTVIELDPPCRKEHQP